MPEPRLRGRARFFAALLFFSAAFAGRAAAYATVPRYGQAAALMTNGQVLVVGGIDGSGNPTNSVEILDTTRGSEFVPTSPTVPAVQPEAVSAAANLNTQRSSATITVLPNGNVLVTGGWDGANARSDAEVYTPGTNTWAVVAGMSSGRFNHTATLLNTGKVLVCGGQTGAAPPAATAVTAACDLFTPAGTGGAFTPAGSMLLARALHTATLLTDGTVWVAGGWNPNPVLTSPFVVTTERYNPASNQWSQSAVLNIERAYHTATLTGDDKVLVAGGFNGLSLIDASGFGLSQGFLNSTELFDPTGGSIVPGPPMQARVHTQSAVLLPSGLVSSYGGIGNIPTTVNTQSLTFDVGSTASVGGGSGSASIQSAAPIVLGTPVAGTIIDGDIEYSSPTVTFPFSGLSVSFASSSVTNEALGLRLSLNGATVGCTNPTTCGVVSGDFPFLNMAQNSLTTAGWFTPTVPLQVTNTSNLLVTGTIVFSPTPISASGSPEGVVGGGSSFTTDITVPVPSYLAGQSITNVTLTLGGGGQAVLTQQSSYTVTLNGGSGTMPGPYAVTCTGTCSVTIPSFIFNTGLSGTIVVGAPAPYQITSPMTMPLAGGLAQLTSLSAAMTFKTTGVDLCETASGTTQCGVVAPAAGTNSYVVIRKMQFADDEFFVPKTNQWAFQPPDFTVTRPGTSMSGASAIVMPSGDELDIGGQVCSGGGCTPRAGGTSGSRQDIATLYAPLSTTAGSGDLIPAHAFHTANLLPDGTILVAGGTDGTNVLQSAEIFSPATGKFTLTATPLNYPREHHTTSLLPNGRVLLAGGFTSPAISTGPTSTAELYFPNTRVFIPAALMISSRSQHMAVSLPNGNVFVAGGYTGLTTVTNTAEIYQSTTNTWIPTASMPDQGRANAAAVQLKDGTIMVSGGTNQNGLLNTVLIYTPTTNSWATLSSDPMPAALQAHSATLLFDGRVLVAGGDAGNGETASSFLYDPTKSAGSRWSYASPLNNARFDHSATLLPNGTVMVSGGVAQALLGGGSTADALQTIEIFHPATDSWTSSTTFSGGPRSFQTATLAPNGRVYFIGGANGSIGSAPSFYTTPESVYLTVAPDEESINSPSLRQSSITYTTPSPFLPGSSFEVRGIRFRGATEASGGAAGPANTSFNSPHLILQKIDGSSSGGTQSNPGFVANLTQAVYANSGNQTTLDTNLTVTLPANAALPYGWYMPWVAANDIHTVQSPLVQVGPALPTAPVTGLTGATLGISSITYRWTGITGVDGYDVYAASNNVFLGSVPAGGPLVFIETGLTPGSQNSIVVAGYTLSGDGPLTTSGIYFTVALPAILSVNGTPASSTSIQWNWIASGSPASYQVYDSSTNQLLANTNGTSFLDTGLGVNTERSIMVGETFAGGGMSPLSAAASAYTMAQTPVEVPLPLTSETTGSFTLTWTNNGNPAGTPYQVDVFQPSVSTTTPILVSTTTNLTFNVPGLSPNQFYTALVGATNGNATAATGGLVLASSFTLAAQPTSLQILGTTPVSVSLNWSGNGNSTFTAYQITYSLDDFVTNVATAVPFSKSFLASTVTISGLLTSTTYWIRVQAINGNGQLSPLSLASIAVPTNGGAASGSLSGVLKASGGSEFSGYIGALGARFIDIRSPGGSFPSDTSVTVSTYSLIDHGPLCPGGVLGAGGAGVVLSITDNPALQPSYPVYLTMSYTNAEAASFTAPTSQLSLARYDPGSGTCVPLQTSFNAAAGTFVAELNHFSLYQLVAVTLETSADSARLYPNPYRTAVDGYVTIDQVPPGARVRIFTLRGERILDTAADGAGNVTWSANNTAGRPVASGLYLVVVEGGGTKKIMKLAVIR